MYKRAREVAELLPLRCILNCLDTMDLMYVLATGQTSSLSKLMMQHEVTWLFRRSPRLHIGQLGHYDGLPDCTLL